MKLGITGLPGSGKATIFEALTGSVSSGGRKGENRIGTVRVTDDRVNTLSSTYNPQKTIYAQVEYLFPGRPEKKERQSLWTQVRDADALVHVIRNFGGYGYTEPTPAEDFIKLDQELIIEDLVIVEKRLERLELDRKRGKKVIPQELALLKECLEALESEVPIRKRSHLASAPLLKGYAFLSGKPMLVLFNNEDNDDRLPAEADIFSAEDCTFIRGRLEQELSQMSAEEAEEFLSEFNITASAMDRIIRQSYELLDLASFFTVGEDEVRAWTIKKHTPAVDAAAVIHTDIQKGFIRAEVLAYDDLMAAGSYPEARKKGTVRLEGKTYEVKDGDIINFRFNV